MAYIDDDTVKSYIVVDKNYYSGTNVDAIPRLEAYLKKHGHRSEDFLGFNKRISYNEGVLEENEAVAVLGRGKWRDAEEVGLPGKYGKVLVMTREARKPIY